MVECRAIRGILQLVLRIVIGIIPGLKDQGRPQGERTGTSIGIGCLTDKRGRSGSDPRRHSRGMRSDQTREHRSHGKFFTACVFETERKTRNQAREADLSSCYPSSYCKPDSPAVPHGPTSAFFDDVNTPEPLLLPYPEYSENDLVDRATAECGEQRHLEMVNLASGKLDCEFRLYVSVSTSLSTWKRWMREAEFAGGTVIAKLQAMGFLRTWQCIYWPCTGTANISLS